MRTLAFCRTALACAAAGLLMSSCAGEVPSAAKSGERDRTADTSCDLIAAPDGSDRAAGTTSAPLRTVRRLTRRLRSGQVGCLREGRYSEDVTLQHSRVT